MSSCHPVCAEFLKVMSDNRRTEQRFWDTYWVKQKHSRKSHRESLQIREIKRIFHHYLPKGNTLQVLEIGGAYGEYLMYLHDRFHHQVSSLDYSSEGNEATRNRFIQAGKEVRIIQRDLFSNLSDLPRFDIVFSLGFIEHFDDPLPSITKHLELVKPGGILLLGVPNLGGIYKSVLRKTAPSFEESHNLKTMDPASWEVFEQTLHLETLFKGYIGGFEPLNMKKLERKGVVAGGLNLLVSVLTVILSFHFQFLRRFNSPFWSGYLIGIYKKA